MLLKPWHFALIVFAFLAISCENDKNDPTIPSTPAYPVGREFNVRLGFAPFLEVDEQPLARSADSGLPYGLYAVNVFWKGKGLTSFQPYASGLFNDPYRVEIGLIEGYTYRFDCSFLGDADCAQYLYSKTEDNQHLFGLPFSCSPSKGVDGAITNDLLISINPLNTNQAFYQHIYKGEMQMKEDSTSLHPTVKRFFGSRQLDFSTADMNTFVSLTLKRAYYSLQFATNELNPGDSIRIEGADIAPFYLLYAPGGTSQSEERILSMYDLSDVYTAGLREEETVPFTISYRPADGEEWHTLYAGQGIKLKRNKKNRVRITRIDKYIGNVSISFGENTEMEEAEQEIGK